MKCVSQSGKVLFTEYSKAAFRSGRFCNQTGEFENAPLPVHLYRKWKFKKYITNMILHHPLW